MITAFFPITGLVVLEKAHAFYPFRRLPGVELWNDQAHWATVFRRNWRAIVHEGKKRVFFQKVFDGNVRGPTVIVSESQYKLYFRFHVRKLGDFARRDPGPDIVEPRPARYAMKVCVDFYRGQLDKFIQRKRQRVFDEALNLKLPGRQIDLGRTLRIQHGPSLCARLSRRNAILAPRVGADYEIRFPDLFGFARLGGLIFWIFY